MSAVVIVHAEYSQATIDLLESAGFHVDVAGKDEAVGYDPLRPCDWAAPCPRTVLIVTPARVATP